MRRSALTGALLVTAAMSMPAMANDSVLKATSDPANWAIQSGDYAGTRFSKLDQITKLLSDSLFTPLDLGTALHMPPMHRPWLLRWATGMERLGGRLWPVFAGVHIIEVRKEIMSAMPRGKAQRVRGQLITLPTPLRRSPNPCSGRAAREGEDVRIVRMPQARRVGSRAERRSGRAQSSNRDLPTQ